MKLLILASIFYIVATEEVNLRQVSSFDSRLQGWVGPIRNEGSCQCGWAFAAIACVEIAYAKATGGLYDFSEQQLVDCVRNGGNLANALIYLQANSLNRESQYPFTGRQASCKATTTTYKIVPIQISPSIQSIQLAIMNYGAVGLGVDASNYSIYGGGILRSISNTINHAVALVGWGVSGSDTYWIARNSWGTAYGESGYLRITMAGCKYTQDNVFVVNKY